jgi:hypothetical protein
LRSNKFDKATINRLACNYVEPKEHINFISCSKSKASKTFNEIICTCIRDLIKLVSNYLLDYLYYGVYWIRTNLYPEIRKIVSTMLDFLNFSITEDFVETAIDEVMAEIDVYLSQGLNFLLVEIANLETEITNLICDALQSFNDLDNLKHKRLTVKVKSF